MATMVSDIHTRLNIDLMPLQQINITNQIWDDELHYLASLNARTCLLKHDDCNHSYRFRNVGQNLLALSRSKLTNVPKDTSIEVVVDDAETREDRDRDRLIQDNWNTKRNRIIDLDNNMIRKRELNERNEDRIMNKELMYEINVLNADNLNGLWQKSEPLPPINVMNKTHQVEQNRDKNTILKREIKDIHDHNYDLKIFQQNYIYYRWTTVNISQLIEDTLVLWFDSQYHLMDQKLVDKFVVTEDL